MSTTFWVWVHLSFILLVGRLLIRLTRQWELPVKGYAAALLLIGALSMMPYQGVDLAGWLLALTGMLSVGSLLVLLLGILPRLGVNADIDQDQQRSSWPLWLILGMALYPAALGWVSLDTYAWGYDPLMSWICLGLSPLFWLLRQRLIGLWLSLSVLAWTIELGESSNLWDYLIDPWLVMAAIVWLIGQLSSKRPHQVGQEGP
jgi:hypothetical protein